MLRMFVLNRNISIHSSRQVVSGVYVYEIIGFNIRLGLDRGFCIHGISRNTDITPISNEYWKISIK